MRIALGLSAALLLGCSGSRSEEQPVLKLAAPFDDAVDVTALAWEAGCRMAPRRGDERVRARVVEVLDVNRFVLETDRGVEVVEIEALGGMDPRLPDEVNAYLRDEGRAAAEAWLTQADSELFTVLGENFVEAGVHGGPSLPSHSGHRFVSLERHRHGAVADYRFVAIARGWAYSGSSHHDALAIDPRYVLTTPMSGGLDELAVVREAKESYERESGEWLELTDAELQARGEDALRRVAELLDWEPAVELEFRRVDDASATEALTRGTEAARAALNRWLVDSSDALIARLAAEGTEAQYEIKADLPPLEEEVEEMLATLNGYSPAGSVIYLLERPVPLAFVDAVLVHEVAHQFQEEVTLPDYFPHPGLPMHFGEAHAEWIARRVREAGAPGAPVGSMDYVWPTQLFEFLLDELEIEPDELLARFTTETWDREAMNLVLQYQATLQEWMLEELDRGEWDDVVFTPVEAEAANPVVEIHNHGATRLDARFRGVWIWSFANELEHGTVTLDGPPFDLVLEPGESVVVTVAREPHWEARPPKAVTALFSRTQRP